MAPKEPGDGHRRFGSRMTRKQSKLGAAIFADRLEELLAQARAGRRDAALASPETRSTAMRWWPFRRRRADLLTGDQIDAQRAAVDQAFAHYHQFYETQILTSAQGPLASGGSCSCSWSSRP